MAPMEDIGASWEVAVEGDMHMMKGLKMLQIPCGVEVDERITQHTVEFGKGGIFSG